MDYTLAELKTSGKDWYVYYSFRDTSGYLVPWKTRNGINRIKDLKEKRAYGAKLVAETNELLKTGWRPNDDKRSPYAGMPLVKVIDAMIDIKRPNLRPRSITHYEAAKKIFSTYLNNDSLLPRSFTESMALAFSDYLATEKKAAGKSHNSHIGNISSFFNMMIEREIIDKNPFRLVKKKPHDTGRNVAFSDEQREKIKKYLIEIDSPLTPLVQIIYYCFIRPNELMQLQRKHFDFKSKKIDIPAHVSKNRKQSSVEMPVYFAEYLELIYEKVDPEWFICGRGLIPHPVPVHRNRITEAHKLVLRHLKIGSEHTLYSWKHTGNVAFAKAGGDPYAAMRQNRHHSIEQTMIYWRTLGLTPNTAYTSKQTKF